MPLILLTLLLAAAALASYWLWSPSSSNMPADGFISGNGRVEATEIDLATKLAGRVQSVEVNEGDFVKAGQPLAKMQVRVLEAQLAEAQAQLEQAESSAASIEAQIAQRRSDRAAAEALVVQREAELDAAQRRLARSETLAAKGASSMQELDDDRARRRSVQASLEAAKAHARAADAATEATIAQLVAARAVITAMRATVERVNADIADSVLVAPRDGRIQYRLAEPGEVLPAGGKVLNMLDLSDVYMTFFVPEAVAGRLALGAEVRIVLDAAPEYVIPAAVSFVSSAAQFTPKSVETASERQKLMFRVKARISPELLLRNLTRVKTGLPGVAWIRIDEEAPWPTELTLRVPQ